MNRKQQKKREKLRQIRRDNIARETRLCSENINALNVAKPDGWAEEAKRWGRELRELRDLAESL